MYFVIYNASQLNLYYLPILERYMNEQCWGSSTSVPENINIIIFYIITKGTPRRQNGVIGISKGELWRHLWCCRKMVWFAFPRFRLFIICPLYTFFYFTFIGVGWLVCDTEVKHTCPQPVTALVSRLVFTGSITALLRNLWFQNHLKPTSG